MSVFVNQYGNYVKLTGGYANKSINDISLHLNYHPDKIHTFLGVTNNEKLITTALLEIFTNNIIAIITKSEVEEVSITEIKEFLKGYSFEDEYSSYTIQDILLNGIENKSLDLDFMARVLDFKVENPNEEYYSEKIDTHLFFINGYLASFKYGSELNKWARHLKSINADIIVGYAQEAKTYWGDDYESIFNEINLQADSFASTPQAYSNEYLKEHITEFGNVDFVMLLVCHYGQKINLSEFKNINYGRYNIIEKSAEIEVYVKGNFIYSFNKRGILEKISKR